MKMNISQEKALRWAAQGLTVVLVAVAAIAVVLYVKVGELEAFVSQAKAEADAANQAGATARKKLQDELKASGARLAALEQQQNEANTLKILLSKAEPQIAGALEAVAGAKASKPDVRAAALAGLGLIGQIAHGNSNEAALSNLDRALAIDKANCVAALAVNLGGAKQVEVTADCQALLPAVPVASDAKPAAEAKPAPAKPEAAPAGAAKVAPGAGKS